MDEDKLLILEELEKRNELPPNKKKILEELRNRNVIRQRPTSITEKIGYLGQGLNTELANLAGSVVDLVNYMPSIAGKTATNIADFSSKIVPFLASRGSPVAEPVLASDVEKKDTPVYNIPTITELLGGTSDAIGGRKNLISALRKTNMGYGNRDEVPKTARPYAVAGETIAKALPFIAAPFAAVRNVAAGSDVTGLLAPILRKAKDKPTQFAGTEGVFTGYSATGAGIAEGVAPGDPTARLIGEVVAPFSPVVVSKAVPTIGKAITFGRSLTSTGREKEAATVLQKQVYGRGESPEKIAKDLNKESSEYLTAGQITGSDALLAIEKRLLSGSAQLEGKAAENAKLAIKNFNEQFKNIVKEGDPDAIKQAAKARLEILNNYFDARVANAESKMLEAEKIISSPLQKDQINIEARKILDEALLDGRKTESSLWDLVAKNAKNPIKVNNFKNALQDIKTDMLLGDKLDPILEAYYKRLKKINTMPVMKLVGSNSLTSKLYLKAKDLRSQGKSSEARNYETIAKAIQDDVSLIKEEGVLNYLDDARQFSLKLNNLFTKKSKVRAIISRDRFGGDKIPYELTLSKGFTPKEGNLFLKDLRQAAGLGINPNRNRISEMEDLQNNLLRELASETRNANGTINPSRLDTFIRNNKESLKTANLDTIFQNASDARRIGQKIIDATQKNKIRFKEKSLTSRIAKEDINNIIYKTFNSSTLYRDLNNLSNIVRNQGKPGMQYAIMENILQNSTIQDRISGKAIKTFLSKQTERINPRTNRPFTVAETLLDKKLLSQNQLENLQTIANKTEIFENSLRNRGNVDDLLGTEDAVFDLLTRIGGANIGTAGAVGTQTGNTLIAASAGSKFLRNLLNKMPRTKVRDILVEAMYNPKLMQKLLEKPTSAKAKNLKEKQINAFLLQTGILTNDAYYEDE